MLRTCIGAENATTKETTAYPNFTTTEKSNLYDNGDIFGNTKLSTDPFYDPFRPETIPGLPRHRPGDYSPRYEISARTSGKF